MVLAAKSTDPNDEIRRVESVMGTIVIVAVRAPLVADNVLDRFFDRLRAVDAQFSPYRDDSEVSRLARGEINELDTSDDLRHVLAACDHLTEVTGGAFDERRHRTDGRLDPSGYVKGWAIEEAAWLLDTAGARNYWVSGGGDIVARGEAAPGQPWRVGIRHPDRVDRVAAVMAVSDRAVATSGNYERGEHILDPRGALDGVGVGADAARREGASGLRSLTVVGPRLAFTDAYATALFVMGLDGLGWLASHPEYEAYAITADDRTVWTPGMERYLVRD